MTPHERIIRNALNRDGRFSYGEGGKAAAKIYKELQPSAEKLLYAIAIMANGLADMEDA